MLTVSKRYRSEDQARIERRDLINRGFPVSLLTLDAGNGLFVFDLYIPDSDDDDDQDEPQCSGHESLSGAHMGETTYCDGTCQS